MKRLLANRRPRRGSQTDAFLRRKHLKQQKRQARLPRKRDLPRLEAEAMKAMRRIAAELG